MYHPINKINCPPLNKLNELARLTLEFCLTQQLALSEAELRERFVQHFSAYGYPKAGDWLWGKTVLVRPPVLALVAFPLVEKQPIFDVYRQNQQIEVRFATGAFVPVSIPPASQDAYQAAAELAANFYNILCDGVPSEKINEPDLLDRQTVLRAYLNAQKPISMKVCPGCDGKAPSVSDGIIREDLDHFFPKSKYPFLSIHPLNLTPLCKNCNQTYKGSKDAILDADPVVADVNTLDDIYHPYQRPAKDQLSLEIQHDAAAKPGFHFACLSPDAPHPARLHSLQYILDLEKRWTGDLDEERTEEILHALLLQGAQDDMDENFQPDMAWLKQHLSIALGTLRRQQTRNPDYVMGLAYAKWIASDPKLQDFWLTKIIQRSLVLPVSY